MDLFSNFLLNTVGFILRQATQEPDRDGIRSMLDQLMNHHRTRDNGSDQERSRSPPTRSQRRHEVSTPCSLPSPMFPRRKSNLSAPSRAPSPLTGPNANIDMLSDDNEEAYHSAVEDEDDSIINAREVSEREKESKRMAKTKGIGNNTKNNAPLFTEEFAANSHVLCQPVKELTATETGKNVDSNSSMFIDESTANSHNIRFPNGDITYRLRGLDAQLGYALVQYDQRDNLGEDSIKFYKKCLGVFECPVAGCQFRSRPMLPKSRSKTAVGRPPKVTRCKVHPSNELVRCDCNVIITVTKYPLDDYVEIHNNGIHDHLTPPVIRPTKQARKEFNEEVNRNPQAKPISLITGTSGREPVWKMDESLLNIDRVRYLRRKWVRAKKKRQRPEMSELALESPDDIVAFDKVHNLKLITKSSLSTEDGGIIMQTDMMRKVLAESWTASQTDTIEKYIISPKLPTVNLTVTSTYCHVREKWVATQYGILFGKSEKHYARYFYTLLKHMPFENFQSFVDEYLGMVCDFCDGERKGFELALQKKFKVEKENYPMEKFYVFCIVHWARSVCRIRRNHAIVKVQRSEEFKKLCDLLTTDMERRAFDELVQQIKKEFPKCTKWLDWYLHPDRAKMIFPAMAEEEFASDGRDTNAQESMGRTLKMGSEYKNPTIAQAYFMIYQNAAKHDYEYSLAQQGLPMKYGPPRVKRAYVNLGRAPDTNEAIFGDSKRQKTGRPRNTPNKAPSGIVAVDCTLAMPWAFTFITEDSLRIKATNTCAPDTVLMAMFNLRKYDDELFLDFKMDDKVLTEVLDMIQCREYARARYTWIVHTEGVTLNRGRANILARKMKSNDDDFDESWNCQGAIVDSIACINMFRYRYRDDYESCSNGDVNCPYMERYMDEEGQANNETLTRGLWARFDKLHDIQEGVLNPKYNSHDEEVLCGSGSGAIRNDKGEYECGGIRRVRTVVLEPMPTLLRIEQATVTDGQRSKLTSMDKIEPQLKLNDTRYVLVQVILSNDGHFRGVTVVHGKYLLYDGMFGGNKLRWIGPKTKFASGGDYFVCELWYRKCSAGGSEDALEDGAVEGQHEEDSNVEKSLPSNHLPAPSTTHVPRGTTPTSAATPAKTKDTKPKTEKTNTQLKSIGAEKAKGAQGSKSIPMGLSIGPVSKYGRQPDCRLCQKKIARQEWHIIKRGKNERNEKWATTSHYHFHHYQFLSTAEQRQLIAMLEASEDVGEEVKRAVSDSIFEYLSRSNQ